MLHDVHYFFYLLALSQLGISFTALGAGVATITAAATVTSCDAGKLVGSDCATGESTSQMHILETFSNLLTKLNPGALKMWSMCEIYYFWCERKPAVTDEFLLQKNSNANFWCILFVVLKKLLNKHVICRWFVLPWPLCDSLEYHCIIINNR